MPTTNPWTALVGQDSPYRDKKPHQHHPNKRNHPSKTAPMDWSRYSPALIQIVPQHLARRAL